MNLASGCNFDLLGLEYLMISRGIRTGTNVHR